MENKFNYILLFPPYIFNIASLGFKEYVYPLKCLLNQETYPHGIR
jgi:hypothetical protein